MVALVLQHFTPWQALMDTADFIRERMFKNLNENERLLKEAALDVVKEFRSVLFSTAQRLDSQRVQELMRLDPFTFQSWSPAQWQAFFDSILNDGTGWSSRGGSVTDVLRLEAENCRLRQDGEHIRKSNDKLQGQAADLQRRLAEVETRLRHLQAARSGAEPASSIETIDNGVYVPLLKAMKEWQVPTPPARFKTLVSDDPVRWRRQSMSLYIMASTGISSRVELDYLVGVLEGVKSRSSSLRTTLDLLADHGLAIGGSFSVAYGAFQSALSVMRLSEAGKELCRILGWEPVESEWERINRLHDGERSRDHTFGLLAFSLHARLRGWQVQVIPDVSGTWQPDVRIQRQETGLFVEVEMSEKENPAKWQQLAALQGKVALCAATRKQQAALTSDCKMLKLAGMATSLENLVAERIPDIKSETPLWEETWEAS